MKYYLIVGEASGDLHASNLMKSILQKDNDAQFRFFGGDLMKAVGGTLVKHYKDMAYMGFIPVLLHLREIFGNMDLCKRDILRWQPDVVILVDYPGFNLKIAEFIKKKTSIPVYYYISPKIWAWKEHRIHNIKHDVDELFSILPFEVDFFKKHDYPIHYIGNPCVDAVEAFKRSYKETTSEFCARHALSNKPIVAVLAGSRKQEIKDNLSIMIQVVNKFPACQFVVAGAPAIDKEYYKAFLPSHVKLVFGETYALLSHADAAIVTSGTATLETALFRVPQVVCYYTAAGKVVALLRKLLLKVPYISLVNLIRGKKVVSELVADEMTALNVELELKALLNNKIYRQGVLDGYEEMAEILGPEGASSRAAEIMVRLLRER